MDPILIESAIFRLAFAGLAVGVTWGLLRLLDKAAGVPFRTVVREIADDAGTAALYYGLRFLGACLLVGYVLS